MKKHFLKKFVTLYRKLFPSIIGQHTCMDISVSVAVVIKENFAAALPWPWREGAAGALK
jgi:hypothetical protein